MGTVTLTGAMTGLGSSPVILQTLLIFCTTVFSDRVEEMLADYHNYTELMSELDSLVESYPHLARIYSLGNTTENRELIVIQISQGVTEDRVRLKPMMKLIANMHGNEAVGRELMLALSAYLLENFETDERVRNIVSQTDIHIMPSLNPDGFEKSTLGVCSGHHIGTGRHNGNNIDLNRAFPTWDDVSLSQTELLERSEPEVAAVVDWVFSQPFVLSANFHDGAVVVNYPYDDSYLPSGQESLTPDDETFVAISKLYARQHTNMHQGKNLCYDDDFPDGITNGAEWYVVEGGMQDFNYIYSNCFELTIELSRYKYPPSEELEKQWNYNQEALLSFLEVVQTGVRGIVTDDKGEPLPNANIEISGISEKNITTSYFGEYWRLLAPGNYCIRATSPDESLMSEWKMITTSALDSKQHIRLDFQLSPSERSLNTDCHLHLHSGHAAMAGSVGQKIGAQSLSRNNALLVFQIFTLIFYIYCT